MRPSAKSSGSRKHAPVDGPSRAAPALVTLAGALIASGCSLVLGADRPYYEVAVGGAGGATIAVASSSSGDAASSASTSGGSGGGAGGSGGNAASTASMSSTASSSAASSSSGVAPNDTCWHGDPADPGGGDGCGAGTVAVLADNFNDNTVGPLWVNYQISATAQEANHQVVISVPGAAGKFAGFVSTAPYSLVGCHSSIQVVQSPQHPSTIVHSSLSPDPSSGADLIEFHQIGNSLMMSLVIGGTATPDCVVDYHPGTHQYWRMRELGGFLLWETSPDGQKWTVLRREIAPGFISAVRVDFGVIPIAPDIAGVGIFDNFDMP